MGQDSWSYYPAITNFIFGQQVQLWTQLALRKLPVTPPFLLVFVRPTLLDRGHSGSFVLYDYRIRFTTGFFD